MSFTHTPQDKGLAVQLALGSLHQASMASRPAQDGEEIIEEGVLALERQTLGLSPWMGAGLFVTLILTED